MPLTPPVIFIPPAAGPQPAAPGAIHTTPAGSAPAAPGAIHTPPAGSAPAAPGAIHTPPAGATSPSTAASILIDPTGEDNAILYVARTAGAEGNNISIAYAAAAASVQTLVNVVGSAITVTPGNQARMQVSGPAAFTGKQLRYAGQYNGKAHWATDGFTLLGPNQIGAKGIYYDGSRWVIESVLEYKATKTSTANSPVGLSAWTLDQGSDQPTITASVSDAWQVASEINSFISLFPTVPSPSRVLVNAIIQGTGIGAIQETSQTFLTGGTGAAQPPGLATPPAITVQAPQWPSATPGAIHTPPGSSAPATPPVVQATPAPVKALATETFDTSATTAANGWTGSGNTSGSNSFGWANTDVVLGTGTGGAMGGIIARTSGFNHFADTSIATLSRTDTIRLAGSMRLANTNFDGDFYLGYFTAGQGAADFIGIHIAEPSGGAGDPFRGFARVNGSGGAATGIISLPQNTTLAFDLLWTGSPDGSGTLSGTLAGQTVNIPVAAGGGRFAAFGLLSGGSASNSTMKTAGCYFDGLTYNKTGSAPPAAPPAITQ